LIFLKAPSAVLDYTVNWDDGYLESGETVSTSSWAVQPDVSGGVEIDSDAQTSTTATATISGGRHGKLYRLRNTVITNNSRTDVRTVYVLVWEPR